MAVGHEATYFIMMREVSCLVYFIWVFRLLSSEALIEINKNIEHKTEGARRSDSSWRTTRSPGLDLSSETVWGTVVLCVIDVAGSLMEWDDEKAPTNRDEKYSDSPLTPGYPSLAFVSTSRGICLFLTFFISHIFSPSHLCCFTLPGDIARF